MSATPLDRRALLSGAALTGAAAVGAVALLPSAASATPVGPWEYVAPGSSIQAAITAGAKAIQLGAGTYNLTAPIVMTRGCSLRGVGQSTRLLVTTAFTGAVIKIGNGGPIDGVSVSDLVINCDSKATNGIDLNIVGTTGNYESEPDAVTRLDDLWVFNSLGDGIIYQGSDTQATITSRVRVRRALGQGFNVSAPDNVFLACEATSANGYAGFYVNSANCHFHGCKAWYNGTYGWHVRGSRNVFTGCESQDTKSHGWYVEYAKCTITGCMADTSSAAGLGGTVNGADGFYVVGATDLIISSCIAFDRKPGGIASQQRYGFNIPTALKTNGFFGLCTGWDNATAAINLR